MPEVNAVVAGILSQLIKKSESKIHRDLVGGERESKRRAKGRMKVGRIAAAVAFERERVCRTMSAEPGGE